MKKLPGVLAIVLVLCLTLSGNSSGNTAAFAAVDPKPVEMISIKVNGAQQLGEAFIRNGRIMVPLRTVSEAMGAKVKWNASKKSASVVKGKHSFELSAGQLKALRNGSPIVMDTEPVMKEGHLFIPLRFSAESLGGTAKWNSSTREVNIYPDLTPEQAKQAVKELADQVIQSLKDQDIEQLAKLSHSKGVTFSPYAYVDRTKDVTLSKEKLSEGFENKKTYQWGKFDGSGKPISMSFENYYKKFVYSQDFAKAPYVGYNESKSQGNTINNASKVYPGAVFVEYYFDGINPEYGGIDWQSLRLVFQKEGSSWVLSGIIHDEWTI
ncbi:Copper amine oxidase N-terminal domain-containing protein [Paenibacillus uliginis N3/975]|uniref:Copper amine oxidase N-terminal domain-containing protein n=1 Tax=Paenibacillus uliginis N3/975 TaxID=1313296 RepID=A0A1X7H176_9BACL|nr:stalk domain-containing protein [Paenibacillus uliginis]SMF77829.1 Copper amine oxidase N-terminal domain-containing protein [Paenibacillus uliginis N3/975]